MQLSPVLRGERELLRRRKLARDLRAPRLGERLAVEDQAVLREVDDERQADRNCRSDLEYRGDQTFQGAILSAAETSNPETTVSDQFAATRYLLMRPPRNANYK